MDIGLEKGDRVAIWAPNVISWYLSFLAISRVGMISVALNPAYQIPEMKYVLKKVGAKAIICMEKFKTQNYYEMLNSIVPELKNSRSGIIYDNKVNALQSVIIDTDNVLPYVFSNIVWYSHLSILPLILVGQSDGVIL